MIKKDASIYEIPLNETISSMKKYDMKTIIIKGIGYFVVGKNSKITAETFLNLALSMEQRNITV